LKPARRSAVPPLRRDRPDLGARHRARPGRCGAPTRRANAWPRLSARPTPPSTACRSGAAPDADLRPGVDLGDVPCSPSSRRRAVERRDIVLYTAGQSENSNLATPL